MGASVPLTSPLVLFLWISSAPFVSPTQHMADRKEKTFGVVTELSRNPISAACVTSTIFHNLSKLQFPHLGNESSGGSFPELF